MTVTRDYGENIGIHSHTMRWSRSFDAQGRVVTEYYPQDHRIDYGYDLMGRLNVLNWADRVPSAAWSTPRSLVSSAAYNAPVN